MSTLTLVFHGSICYVYNLVMLSSMEPTAYMYPALHRWSECINPSHLPDARWRRAMWLFGFCAMVSRLFERMGCVARIGGLQMIEGFGGQLIYRRDLRYGFICNTWEFMLAPSSAADVYNASGIQLKLIGIYLHNLFACHWFITCSKVMRWYNSPISFDSSWHLSDWSSMVMRRGSLLWPATTAETLWPVPALHGYVVSGLDSVYFMTERVYAKWG